MKFKTVEGAWDSYLRDVIPETARAVQVNESKRAFYGGAAMMFHLMVELSDTPDEDKAVDKVQELFTEVSQFINQEGGG